MSTRQFILPVAIFLVSTPAHGDAEEKSDIRLFEIRIDTDMTTDLMGNKQQVKAEARLLYCYERRGRESSLSFKEVALKTDVDGKPQLDSFMSRSRFRYAQGGKSFDFSADDAPNKLRALLKESFDVPLCKFTFDENGSETKRSVIADTAAGKIVSKEILANARFMHAPFFGDKEKWELSVEVGAGNNVVASGRLVYRKQTEKGEKRGVVKVTGELEAERQIFPDESTLDVKYSVSGKQTFDKSVGEWVQSDWKVIINGEGQLNRKRVGGCKGLMSIQMKLLPTK